MVCRKDGRAHDLLIALNLRFSASSFFLSSLLALPCPPARLFDGPSLMLMVELLPLLAELLLEVERSSLCLLLFLELGSLLSELSSVVGLGSRLFFLA
jgi:hypothetical protein